MSDTFRDSNDLELLTLHDVGELVYPKMSPGVNRNKKVARLRDAGLQFFKKGETEKSPLVTTFGEVRRWQSDKLSKGKMAEDAARRVS